MLSIMLIVFSLSAFAQNEESEIVKVSNKTQVERVDVELTVNAAIELENALKLEDIREILKNSEPTTLISLKITCKNFKDGFISKEYISYKIEGSIEDEQQFIENVKRIKKAALSYYENK